MRLLLLLLAGLNSVLAEDGLLCEPRALPPTLSIPGDAVFTALIDAHSGENCSTPVLMGLQQMAAVVWAVSTANQLNIVPGVTLGLEVYDTCSEERITERAALSALSEVDCDKRYPLGVLSPPRVSTLVQPLLEALDMEFLDKVGLAETAPDSHLASAAAHVIKALNRSEAAVLAYSVPALRAFSSTATKLGVCVTWEELLQKSVSDVMLDKLSISGATVVIAPWSIILSQVSAYSNASTQLHWLLVPTDITWEKLEEEVGPQVAEGTLLLTASEGPTPRLEEALYNSTDLSEAAEVEVPGALLQQVGRAVQDTASRLQEALISDCGVDYQGLCTQLKTFSSYHQVGEVPEQIVVPPEAWSVNVGLEVHLTRVTRVLHDVRLEALTIFHTSHVQIADNITGFEMPPCQVCACLNSVKRVSMWHLVRWRHEVWVAVLLSIASVGVTCAIAVAIFITVRICKGDVLEGNPTASFMLLLAVILAYCAVLPFFTVGPRVLCTLRELGTCLGHALMLSTMLARAIMLASTDDQGFMSHVNGYLQTALWFFIIAVQVALSGQMLLLDPSLSVPPSGCPSDGASFLLMLSYDMLLLVLLLFACLLVARSKRNYREGICFTVAAVLYSILWLAWIVPYVRAGPEWHAPSAAAGLVGGASSVLVAIFIPRTYLMVSSVARSRLASALPCTAAGMHSSSVLDINYRASHQTLYDSVNVLGPCTPTSRMVATSPGPRPAVRSTGLANPNYYSDQPGGSCASTVVAFGARSSALMPGGAINNSRDRLSPSPDNTYERYDSPPSPHKITRF